jgi:2-C-methyl-D-erythritol 2,4-cyclodiphosphate synthase
MMELNDIRIGHGYDVHRYCEGRDLILGGVRIPYEMGLLGHSDADVLVHAVMDAVIGALGLGDIGKHFPDTDGAYKDIDSMLLAKKVYGLLTEQGYYVVNIDATVIAQKPKLAPYIEQMKSNIAEVFGISADRVNVKATTEEKLGFTGRLEGVSSHAVCIIAK